VLRGNPDRLNQSWGATSLYVIGAVLVVAGAWMNPLQSVPPTRAGIRWLAVAVTTVGLLCLLGGASVGG
jgi:hypothetical protein